MPSVRVQLLYEFSCPYVRLSVTVSVTVCHRSKDVRTFAKVWQPNVFKWTEFRRSGFCDLQFPALSAGNNTQTRDTSRSLLCLDAPAGACLLKTSQLCRQLSACGLQSDTPESKRLCDCTMSRPVNGNMQVPMGNFPSHSGRTSLK